LRAAITHFGNHGNGHYVCYRQHPFKAGQNKSEQAEDAEKIEQDEQDEQETKEEQWWRLSDENVYEVSEEEALRQGKVFMLFYERSDDEPIPSEPDSTGVMGAADAVTSFRDVPLPPTVGVEVGDFDHSAMEVPLPDDEFDELPLSPPDSPRLTQPDLSSPVSPLQTESSDADEVQPESAYPTPPPDTPEAHAHEDTELSDTDAMTYDSEDGAPSTQMTSDEDRPDNEAEEESAKPEASVPDPSQQVPPPRPHRMRTAGDVGSRRGGADQSLRMVSAL
jgi:ubiquitin carboxyl-terminal hydrolase 1